MFLIIVLFWPLPRVDYLSVVRKSSSWDAKILYPQPLQVFGPNEAKVLGPEGRERLGGTEGGIGFDA